MNTPDVIINLAGPLVRKAYGRRPAFFRPYGSAGDTAVGAASIVAAPILLPVASVALLIRAGWELFQAIWNTFNSFSGAADNLSEAGFFATLSLLAALAAPLSPLINLIDVIGSIVTTVQDDSLTHSFS